MGAACLVGAGGKASATRKLCDAAYNDQANIAQFALNGKATCDDTERLDRHTPLHIAARMGSAGVTEVLLKHFEMRKDLLIQLTGDKAANNSQDTPLHLAMYPVGKPGQKRVVEMLVDYKAALEAKNVFGKTPMHVAAEKGLVELVMLLCDKGAAIDVQDLVFDTPLHEAARQRGEGQALVVQEIARRNAPLHTANEKNKTALHIACFWGNSQVVEVLLMKNAPFHLQDADGETPMHLAAKGGHADIIERLQAMRAPFEVRNKESQTPLHHAAREGHVLAAKALAMMGASLDVGDIKGNTPLHYAVKKGHGETVDEMEGSSQRRGQRMLPSSPNLEGRTPLHEAARKGRAKILEKLAQRGHPCDTLDRRGNSPLHHAVMLEDGHEAPLALMNAKVQLNARDAGGLTALALAVMSGRFWTMKELLKRNAQVELQDSGGNTPLHHAASTGNLKVAELLLGYNSSINLVNAKKETPFMIAGTKGYTEIAKLMSTVAGGGGQSVVVPGAALSHPLQAARPTALDQSFGSMPGAGGGNPLMSLLSASPAPRPPTPMRAQSPPPGSPLSTKGDRDALLSLLASKQPGPTGSAVHQPSLVANPQSGQLAPLNVGGLAGAVASNRPVEVETFISRVVESLGARVVDQKGLIDLASKCAAVAKQQFNCEPTKMKPLYDDLVSRVCDDAKVPGAWVAQAQAAVGSQSGQMAPQQSVPTMASAASGQSASLNAAGLAGVAATGNPVEVEAFITRVVESLGGRVSDQRALQQFATTWSTAARQLNCEVAKVQATYESMVAKIRSDSQVPGGWIAAQPVGVPGQVSGQTTPLDASGLAGLARAGNPIEMEAFMLRVVESLGLRVADRGGLATFASTVMATVKQQNCDVSRVMQIYGDMVTQIRQVAQAPGGWVGSQQPGGPTMPASSQTAPLDATGFAGVVATNNPTEAESFLRRVVTSLGAQANDQGGLSRFASAWTSMVRQENAQGDRVRLIFEDMVAKIRSDTQVPGGWVSAALPAAPAVPVSGQLASLDASGLAGTVATGNVMEMQNFVRRVVTSLGGRVVDDLQGLNLFANTWFSSVRQTNCDVARARPQYDEMVMKIHSDGQVPGGWVAMPAQPLPPSSPQAFQPSSQGQNAALDASGLAGTVSGGSPAELEAFLGRVVASLGVRVIDQRGLTQFANTWSQTVRMQNCDLMRVRPLYEDMLQQIRRDAQTLGGWVTAQQAPSPSGYSGDNAPLSGDGLSAVVSSGRPMEVETFIGRVVTSLGLRLADTLALSRFAETWSMTTRQQNGDSIRMASVYGDMMAKIRSDAFVPGGWVSQQQSSSFGALPAPGAFGAFPPPGQEPVSAASFCAAVATRNPIDVDNFITRVVESLQGRVAIPQMLSQFASTWSFKVQQQNCEVQRVQPIFDEMVAQIRRDAGMAGSWVTAGGQSVAAMPLSGHSAPMDAAGLAGAAATNMPMDVETFIGRVVTSLQGRVVDPQGLARFAGDICARVKQVNCEAERARPIYDEMVSKIRSDAQMPGSWVAGGGSSLGGIASTLPQSGQTAEIGAAGLAAVCATSNPMEVEKFIERVVTSLQGRVANQTGLAQFASTWLSRAREVNCDAERVRPIYDEMLAQIRSVAGVLGAWVTAGGGQAGAVPQSGQIAPLSADGLAGAAATGNPVDIETFIGRVVTSLQGRVIDNRGLIQFASTWVERVKQVGGMVDSVRPLYDEMIAKLRSDALLPMAWISMPPAPMMPGFGAPPAGLSPIGSSPGLGPVPFGGLAPAASPGKDATLDGTGFASVANSGNLIEMEAFVSRLVTSLQGRVADQRGLNQFAMSWSDTARQQYSDPIRLKGVFDNMVAKIRSDAGQLNSWVAAQGPPRRASPLSGQTAPMDAAGMAGVVAASRPQEVETFIGRVVVSLQGRVLDYNGLRRFADTWSAKVQENGCDAERTKPTYEDMMAQMRSDAQAMGAWVSVPQQALGGLGALGAMGGMGSPVPAVPLSGQTAPTDAAGLAGVVAASRPQEVETFIGRVVVSLQGRVLDYNGIRPFSDTWTAKVREQSCDVERTKPIYESMVAQMRTDAQSMRPWLSVPQQAMGAFGGPPSPLGMGMGMGMGAPGPPRPAAPLSGQTAPMDAAGLAGVVAGSRPMEVETFIGRIVASLQGRVLDYNGLRPFSDSWTAKVREQSCDAERTKPIYDSMVAQMRSDAQSMRPWVSVPQQAPGALGAAPPPLGMGMGMGMGAGMQSSLGQTAPISAAGLGQVSASGNAAVVEEFIGRVVQSLQGRVVDQRTLGQFANTWMYKAKQMSGDEMRVKMVYDDMISEIRRNAQTPGSWVSAGGLPTAGASPQSGHNATIDAAGLAGVAAGGNLIDVETFISRVVQSLQGRVVEQRGLGQFASTWMSRAKQVNCEVERVKPIYDEMISRIRSEVLVPGSWVAAGGAPTGLGAGTQLGASPGLGTQLGQTAPVDAAGLGRSAAMGNVNEVEAFISRVVQSLQGRVVDQRRLSSFASTYMYKTRQAGPDEMRKKMVYDDMIAEIRREAQTPGSWVAAGGVPAMGMGASPQSGQTAPISAAGLAGAAATGNLFDVESFISRVVQSLQGRVVEQRGLGTFASTWMSRAKEVNCEEERCRSIYDEMVSKIRNDALVPGGWVSVQGASTGPPAQTGQTASLDAVGLASVAVSDNIVDVETFISRIVQSLRGRVVDQRRLGQFASTWSSKAKMVNGDVMRMRMIHDDMISEVRREAQTPGSWVAVGGTPPVGASPQSGQTAPTDAAGLAGVAASGNQVEVEAFVNRIVQSLQGRVADQQGLTKFAGTWMARAKQVGCVTEQVRPVYDDMIAKVRNDAQTPGTWVAVQGPARPAAPLSGQTAPLDAAGLAGVVAASRAQEVEAFVGRVVVSLQGRVLDYNGLRRFAETWAGKVREQSCDAERSKPTYQDMIAKMQADSQAMGAWVSVPQQASGALGGLGSPRPAAPLSAQTAPMDAAGLAGVVAASRPQEVEIFIGRLVVSLQGRVLDYNVLRTFCDTWSSKVREQSCDVERTKPIYDSMVSQMRMDAKSMRPWVSVPEQAPPPTMGGLGMGGQSGPGQTAPLSAAGMGQVAASGNTVELEAFIGRVVQSLQGHVADQRMLGQFASTWMYKAKQVGGEEYRLRMVYDDMTAEIRRNAQTPGSWVKAGAAPTASPQSGQSATIDAAGLAGTAATGNPMDVETFITRVVQSLQGRVVEQRGLGQFANTWLSRAKLVNCEVERVKPVYDEMVAKIRSDAQTPGMWVASGGTSLGGPSMGEASMGASIGAGETATINAAGMAQVTSGGHIVDLETFIFRVVQSLQGRVADQRRLGQFATTWMSSAKMVNCDALRMGPTYDGMIAAIRKEAQTPGSWVAVGGVPGIRAAPQSGQIASLDAVGFAGAAASGMNDVETFVNRTVQNLQGRVADQRGLGQFVSTWLARAKQVNCETEKVRPVYDDMITKIRGDAVAPGSWVTVGGATPPATSTPSQSGQTASLNAMGLAGVCVDDDPSNLETFIGRIVQSLQGRVTDIRRLIEFATTWMAKVKAVQCDAGRVGPIYDDLIAQIRRDASTPGSWIAVGGMPGMRAPPQSGQMAPLNAAGFAAATAMGNAADVESFVSRVVQSLQGRVVDQPRLVKFAGMWMARAKIVNCETERVRGVYDDVIAEIRKEAQSQGSWIAIGGAAPGAPPQSGQSAPLDASGLAAAAGTNNPMDVETFISRVVQSLQGRVVDQRRLGQFASTWTFKAKQVNCDVSAMRPIYDDMVAEIRREAQTPGSWVSAGLPTAGQLGGPPATGLGGLTPPGGDAGQTAPLNSIGLASAARTGNVMDMETFISRVVQSLQGHVVDKLRLGQIASRWMTRVRDVNFDSERVRLVYDEMVSEIRRDASTPGSWVAAGAGPVQTAAPPQSGQNAPMTAAGLAAAVAMGSPMDMESWITRFITSLQFRVVDNYELRTNSSTWSARVKQMNGDTYRVQPIFDEIAERIRSDASVPGRWVAGSGLSQPHSAMGGLASPTQSGQTASLDAAGMAGVCMGSSSMEVETFIRRVVESLQGRIVEQRGLQTFASTWHSKAREQNCDATRMRTVYDDMITQIRSVVGQMGGWVAAGAATGPSPAASGQNAPLSPDGLASVVVAGNQSEVETFINRVVQSCGARVVDTRKLAECANRWTEMTRQQNCEGAKCRLIYDDLVSKIQRDKTRQYGWLEQGDQMGLGATPQSGQTAPLTATGFAGAVAKNNDADVQTFIGRLVVSLQGRVTEYRGLTQFATTWGAKAKQQNCEVERVRAVYDSMVAQLSSEAQMPGAWLSMPRQAAGVSPQSGQTAPVNANGLAASVASPNPIEAETFISRVITSLGCNVVDQRGFTDFVRTWSNATRQQNCDPIRVRGTYEDMVQRIRSDAQMPGMWVSMQRPTGGLSAAPMGGLAPPGVRESVVSGQTAALNEKGLAGVCASSKTQEIEMFIGRLAVSLGFHVQEYKSLQQLAAGWSSRVRDANCEAARCRPIFSDIEEQIRNDARVPGAWVKDPKAPRPPSGLSGLPGPGALAAPPSGLSGGSPAAPQSGQIAPLNAAGFAAVVAFADANRKPTEVEAFVGRLVYSLSMRTAAGKYDMLKQLAAEWASQVRQQNCVVARISPIYDDIIARIRRDSQTPGAWVSSSSAPVSPAQKSAPRPFGAPPPGPMMGLPPSGSPSPPMGIAPMGSMGRPAPPFGGSPPSSLAAPPPPLAPSQPLGMMGAPPLAPMGQPRW